MKFNKVVLSILVGGILLFPFSNYLYLIPRFIFPKYSKTGLLSERLTSEPTLVRDLLKPGERIAKSYEKLDDKYYEHEGGFVVRNEYYCSYNLSDNVEKISEITGVKAYKGDLKLVSLNDFKNYLAQNQAYCLDVLPLDNKELYGDIQRVFKNVFEWQVITEVLQFT